MITLLASCCLRRAFLRSRREQKASNLRGTSTRGDSAAFGLHEVFIYRRCILVFCVSFIRAHRVSFVLSAAENKPCVYEGAGLYREADSAPQSQKLAP